MGEVETEESPGWDLGPTRYSVHEKEKRRGVEREALGKVVGAES